MLKVLYQKLRLKCKGSLNHNHSNSRKLQIRRVGKTIVQGIPVLSIFALVGIVSYMFGLRSLFINGDNHQAYAIDSTPSTTASLTVNDGNIRDTIITSDDELAYATHNVAVSATNVKTYSLVISGTTNLTTTSGSTTITGAAGNTPATMNNQWGYAWIDSGERLDEAVFNSLSPDGTTLTGLVVDDNHNLSGNKQLVFGVKFGKDAASGTYSTKVNLSLVTTPRIITKYSVSFNCNNGTGCPAGLTTVESDEASYNYTIPTTLPTRSGYRFLGYASTNGTAANPNYAAGKTITLTTSKPSLTLYAIWQSDTNWNSITTLQQMTTEICTSANIGASKSLIDTRDNKNYTVAKLNDGKCWMTQNLALDLSVAGIAKATESDDLSINFPASALPNYTNSWANSTTTAAFSKAPTKIYGSGGAYKTVYGYYYNWCAATAGTCMNGGTTVASGDAAGSICPKGWQLPKSGGSGNEFAALGSATSASGGVNLGGTVWPYVGAFNGAGLIDAGAVGYYWSRTTTDANSAYHLSIGSGTAVNASRSYAKSDGYAVRCVAK